MRVCFFATAAHRAQSWAQLQLLLCLTLAKAGLIHHIDNCFLGSTSQLLGLQRFPCAVFIRGVLLWIKHSSFCWLFCPRSLCHEGALVWVFLHMWRACGVWACGEQIFRLWGPFQAHGVPKQYFSPLQLHPQAKHELALCFWSSL